MTFQRQYYISINDWEHRRAYERHGSGSAHAAPSNRTLRREYFLDYHRAKAAVLAAMMISASRRRAGPGPPAYIHAGEASSSPRRRLFDCSTCVSIAADSSTLLFAACGASFTDGLSRRSTVLLATRSQRSAACECRNWRATAAPIDALLLPLDRRASNTQAATRRTTAS